MQTDRNALTEGVIWKKLLFFALPILLGNIFQQMYNTADALIVGRFLDEAALAAVTSSGSLIFMMVGFLMASPWALAWSSPGISVHGIRSICAAPFIPRCFLALWRVWP